METATTHVNLSSLRAFGEWYGAHFAVLHSPYLIVACGCALALLCLYVLVWGEPPPKSKLRRYPHSALAVVADGSRDKSDKAWRRELSREAYASLRQRITDEPNLLVSQGGLTDLFEYGVFRCAGCGAELYAGETKFEMGCGWPCFYTCKKNAVREQADADELRTELVCNGCNGHLGHLFRNENLGHPPPDERHCVNSSSLTFEPGPVPDDEVEEEQVPESTTRRRLAAEHPEVD